MVSTKITNVLSNLDSKSQCISLEIDSQKKLSVGERIQLSPPFCSVTWLDNNLTNLEYHPAIHLAKELVLRDVNVLIHLPGAIFDTPTLTETLNVIKSIGVINILAVQGEYSLWNGSPKDFPYAKDLIRFIRETYGDYFCIGVVGYPSGHPKVKSLELDTCYLGEKVSAGADFILTQAIFEIEELKNFKLRCNNEGIYLPIIPGICILDSRDTLLLMRRVSKINVPADIQKFLNENADDVWITRQFGIQKAVDIINLIMHDPDTPIRCIHIFHVNNIDNLREVFKRLYP